MAQAKNILFIMFDQLRWDYLSCYGHPHLQTPHMAQWQRERAELGLTGRDITVFEAGGGTAL